MGLWAEQVVPRFTDLTLGVTEVRRHREPVLAGATGDLVEIGFGSGLNVPLYPPSVRRVHAVEPSSVGRRLAAKRVARSPTQGGRSPRCTGSCDPAAASFSWST